MFWPASRLQEKKWLTIVVATFLLLVVIVGAAQYLSWLNPRHTIIRGVWVGSIDLSNQTREQAIATLQVAVDQKKINGQIVYHQNNKHNIPFSINGQDLESAYPLFQYDITKTVGGLMTIGNSDNGWLATYNQVLHYWQPQKYAMTLETDRVRLKKVLQDILSAAESPSHDARPKIVQEQVEIEEHTLGLGFDYDALSNRIIQQAANLSDQPIVVELNFIEPKIKKDEINETMLAAIKNFIEQKKELLLQYEDKKWNIKQEQYLPWLAFAKEDGEIKLVLQEELFVDYILKEVSPEIDQPAKDPKFSITNGRVTEFQSSQSGKQVEISELRKEVNNKFFTTGEGENVFLIQIKETNPEQAVEDINDLGIVEMIGVGVSSFKGSPPNRVHNIKTGANAINGIIIKPAEIFSLIDALGDIDRNNGYLTELVIKGDKTIPEYGGGLCQIGTTTFRAAIDSGLPIVERRNHSYRVVYYEPAGTDATIYDPRPDFKFTNDTGSNILIVTKVVGTDLRFEFWGKKDERIIEYSKPRIFNITKPGPTKLIETTELKPGEKKCIERPHNGADAEFDYKVVYVTGEIKQQTFKSHYIPWPEVCLIGVEKKEAISSEGNNDGNLINTPIINGQ